VRSAVSPEHSRGRRLYARAVGRRSAGVRLWDRRPGWRFGV